MPRMSKTPWTLDAAEVFHDNGSTWYRCVRDSDGDIVFVDNSGRNLHLGTVVSAVNFYTALPEWIRDLKPSTVAKCVEVCGLDAVAALEAEEANRETPH